MRSSGLIAAALLILAFAAPAAAGASAGLHASPLDDAAALAKTTPTTARGAMATATATTTTATTVKQATVSESPVPVPNSSVPPAGRRLSANRVLAIAQTLPKMRAVRAKYPGSYGGAYLKGPLRWQVSFFSKKGASEIGQVIVDDASGRVLEQWTGFQVAWSMARGYPGAFGRHVNALYVWLPLCLLFLLPFVDPRRPLSLLHLDLLVLLSWSVSLAFFNHAHIHASAPLAYPPLAYLLGRMLWLLRRPRPGRGRAGQRPLRLLVPTPWLAFGVVFLLGFRIGLNVTDANVIDVGYAGVIGADKVVHGGALYRHWPPDNEHGDTYGPVSYESYIPFERAFGWSGRWDDLPAAHAAAVVFDLLALGLLFLLGLRIRGPTLGVALAYAWVAYPFTLFALESNSNDTLVAVLILAALLVASSSPARGVFAALAALTKFAPLALVPVLATHGLFAQPDGRRLPAGAAHGPGDLSSEGTGGDEDVLDRRQRARTRARALMAFFIAFAITAAVVSIPAITHDSLRTIYERTIAYQANRGSPFSVWGLYGGLHGVQTAVQVAAVALALALAVLPRRPDVVGLAAACAAIVIAVQLGVEHWFYLYIPWFFPLVMIALLGARPDRPHRRSPPEGGSLHTPVSPGWEAQSGEQGKDAASGPARLRLPSAAWWPSSG